MCAAQAFFAAEITVFGDMHGHWLSALVLNKKTDFSVCLICCNAVRPFTEAIMHTDAHPLWACRFFVENNAARN
jgi:hypothetical protein